MSFASAESVFVMGEVLAKTAALAASASSPYVEVLRKVLSSPEAAHKAELHFCTGWVILKAALREANAALEETRINPEALKIRDSHSKSLRNFERRCQRPIRSPSTEAKTTRTCFMTWVFCSTKADIDGSIAEYQKGACPQPDNVDAHYTSVLLTAKRGLVSAIREIPTGQAPRSQSS